MGGGTQKFAFLFPRPLLFSLVLSLLGVVSWNFGGVDCPEYCNFFTKFALVSSYDVACSCSASASLSLGSGQ